MKLKLIDFVYLLYLSYVFILYRHENIPTPKIFILTPTYLYPLSPPPKNKMFILNKIFQGFLY